MNEPLTIPQFETGLDAYDFIVNNVEAVRPLMSRLINDLDDLDPNGQFLASSARFLASVNREAFEEAVCRLVELAIAKDRERKYIGSLLKSLWGENYAERAEELSASDDNFRRIYKRIYSEI